MATTADERGTSLTEVLVSTALIGVVAAVGLPTFHTYVQGGALKGGAAELAALINVARSTAIRDNTRVCVSRDPAGSGRVRLLIAPANPCAASSRFYGGSGRGFDPRVGTDGWLTLQNEVAVSGATAEVVFTPLGAAVPGGTYTVTKRGRTLRVVVAPSGRVSIAP